MIEVWNKIDALPPDAAEALAAGRGADAAGGRRSRR